MLKVSVIVPIYNVEPYLRRCLDSLVNQTLKDIEIICINDSSPDKSLAILKEYAERDERVKIIDSGKNYGVSIARNSGMKIAKGEYIGFCDPDDYVDLDFYEKLYELAKNKNADIAKAICKRNEIGSNIEVIESTNEKIRKHRCYFYSHFWTAIYRNKMLKKHRVKFPVGIITSQDVCFLNHAVIVAKNVCVLDNTFYHYIRRENSSDSTIYSLKKINLVLKSYCLILNRLDKVVKKDRNYIYIYVLWFQSLLGLLVKSSKKQFVKKIAKTAAAYYQKYKFPNKLNLPKPIVAALENKDEKELCFLLQKFANNGCYPDINIKKTILQNRELYIWGMGADSYRVQTQCKRNHWDISAFLDSNKNMKEFNGYKVKRPESLLNKPNKDFFIIISSRKYAEEITGICRKAGLKTGKDFWRPN